MPKIDPVTGCTVMTTAEFWSSEAEKEGKGRSGGDLRDDFYDELEKDRLAEENRYRDHMVLLETMVEATKAWNEAMAGDGYVPLPTGVIELVEVHVGQTFRSSSLKLVARLRSEEGSGLYMLERWSDYGTRLDPPDGDENLTYEPAGREAL